MNYIVITSLGMLSGILLLVFVYYYYIKLTLRDKVRVFIRQPNKKIKTYIRTVEEGQVKVGKHTYTWNTKICDEETDLQIIPGVYESMKTGFFIEGNRNPITYSTGKNLEVSESSELFTKIVESNAITKFISGFGRIDNETIFRVLVFSSGIIVLSIIAATYYIKPFQVG